MPSNARRAPTEVEILAGERQRAQAARVFAKFFNSLSLAPDTRERLISLFIIKRNAEGDIANEMLDNGIDPSANADQFRENVYNARYKAEAEIANILGEQGYPKYKEYQDYIPRSAVVNMLRTSLRSSANELTETQGEMLVQAMAANKTRQVNDAVVQASAAFLTPAQQQNLVKVQREIAVNNRRQRLEPNVILSERQATVAPGRQ